MQISKRDQKLLIFLAGILILTVSYFFGYSSYKDKREEVQVEIDALKNRYDGLRMKDAKRKEYQTFIMDSENKIVEIASRYPFKVTEEKEIYFITKLEEETGVEVSQINISDPVVSYTSTLPQGMKEESASSQKKESGSSQKEEEASNQKEENGSSTGKENASETDNNSYGGFSGSKTTITLNYRCSYESLKKMIDYINLSKERKTIDNFSVGYDKSTGQIAGNLTYNCYFTDSAYSTYEEPTIPDKPLGVDSILGTTKGTQQENKQEKKKDKNQEKDTSQEEEAQ